MLIILPSLGTPCRAVAMAFILLFAGFENTVNLISNGMFAPVSVELVLS